MELFRIAFPHFVVREVGYAAGGRMDMHAHEYSNITAVISGEMEETTDAGEHRGRSCSVLVKPAGTMHRNVWLGRRGTRTISVEMRTDSPLARELGSRSWQWLEGTETARVALQLCAAIRSESRDAIETAAVALTETAIQRTRREPGPPWLADVKRAIEERFDEPLRFDDLAKEIGLHPVYLSRAFRRSTGVTMGEYVRSLRLRHARHLLSATGRPLVAISAESGFADASHLCRVFADGHRMTPREFRRLTQV